MGCAPLGMNYRAVPDDQFAVLEDIIRLGEHFFAVGIIGIDGNIGPVAGAQTAAILQTDQSGRAGARHE